MTEQNNNENAVIPLEALPPNKLTLIPIACRPIFPGFFTPLTIDSPENVKTVEEIYEKNDFFGIVLVKNDCENPTVNDLHEVGTVARIMRKANLPDGGIYVFISPQKRFKIRKVLHQSAPMAAIVDYLDEKEADTFEVKALTRALISETRDVSQNNPFFPEEMHLNMLNPDDSAKTVDYIASNLNIDKNEQQKLLEITNVRERAEKVLVLIKKEQEILFVQRRVQTELNERIEKNHREKFLREELRSIQEELGELGETGDGIPNDYQKFKRKIDEFKFEGEIKESVESELEKFHLMDPNSSEYIGTRNFLELVCNLPWNENAANDYDLIRAKKILEKDHFGLDDVKKRVVEFLAVRKLKGDNKGSILLLVGPPGVGKTSVGRSIANAMNKPFYRFSVGGMRDEAEIKGHRRTYIGAMPGKIIQGLKIAKSKSPVFMIDEIDKMGSSHNGDPAAALLEVLDSEQNASFRDNYLDLPFDVSGVFFILTANSLDSVPSPLLDRAEIIRLSGYVDQEKIEIAKKYLIPKNLEKNGLKKSQVKYSNAAILKIAQEYARESGVRNFEKSIDKIHRKIATEFMFSKENDFISQKSDSNNASKRSEIPESAKKTQKNAKSPAVEEFTPVIIEENDLFKYLGKPNFDESQIKVASVAGTAIGLAWTSMGGDTLLIESSFFSGKGGLVLTGQMGDVMKESSQIAFDWARKFVLDRGSKKSKWFEENVVHLHIPEGATPKDGPSAGITMATTFVSLFLNKKIKPNLAMTGELSLTGQILPIGGLREKTVAAKRNKIKTIIIPKANERDLEEIPENVKAGIKFVPVTNVREALKLALGVE